MVFDIKGSTINRKTKTSLSELNKIKLLYTSSKVLKDMNFVQINKDLPNPILKLSQDQKVKIDYII